MKKLFILLLLTSFSYAQELVLNAETNIYEFTKIVESDSIPFYKESFVKNLRKLNYKNIVVEDSNISAENFYTKIILGTTIQVNYQVLIDFKETKYKLRINKFVMDERRWAPIPLENIKSGKKKWIKNINENLPNIVKALESKLDNW